MIRVILPFIAMAILTCARQSTLVGHMQVVSKPSHLLRETCKEIATSISVASEVYGFGSLLYYPHVLNSRSCVVFVTGSGNYFEDISHWASSSTQIAACSFEPGTLEDVGIAVSMHYEMYGSFFHRE